MAHRARREQTPATTRALQRVNRTAIIELLRERGALSRREIVTRTGLSPATVNRLTAALIREGALEVAGTEPSTGGRPSLLIRYAGATRSVAVVQLHAGSATGVLVDLAGQIILRRDAALGGSEFSPLPADSAAQRTQLDAVEALLRSLMASARGMGSECIAAAVAVPGTVTPPDGRVASMPELGWDDVPLGSILGETFDIPITVVNDANAVAYGELRRGAGRGTTSLAAILVNRGLGAGIITNGRLHEGANASAGEVGFLVTDRSAFARSYREVGDLEDRISPPVVTRRARERGLDVRPGRLISAEEVLEIAPRSDARVQELAAELTDMIAIAVAAIVIVLDPEVVVVASNSGQAEDLVPQIQARLAGRIIHVPRIESATYGDDAVLVGAAELAADRARGPVYLEG